MRATTCRSQLLRLQVRMRRRERGRGGACCSAGCYEPHNSRPETADCNDENHRLADRNPVYTQATSSRPAQYHHDIPCPSAPVTCSPLRLIYLNPAAFRIWRAAPGAPPPIRKPPRPAAHRPVHLRRWTQKRIASRLCFTIDAALHVATPQLTVVQRTTHTYASPHARNPPSSCCSTNHAGRSSPIIRR